MVRVSRSSAACAIVAFLLAVAGINHGLTDSILPAGPGLTPDESFNIEQGVYLADALSQHGPMLFSPSVAKDVFASPRHLPDHPPLGRLWLGVSHHLTAWTISGSDETVYNVPAARLGSCFAFSLTTLVISEWTRRRFGLLPSLLTAAVYLTMPRVVGHARIAALESMTSLVWITVVLHLASHWTNDRPPALKRTVGCGCLFGLLLLTKVQGVLLPPLLVIWAFALWRQRAIFPLFVIGAVGGFVFFLGWPWLWIDPMQHILQYLGRTTDRQTLYCWYLGARYTDKLVPWHYPFVMTLATLPLSAVVGVAARLVMRRFQRTEVSLALTIVGPLTVFAIPGTPVYDGVRLFLIVMPALAILSGLGLAMLFRAICERLQQHGGGDSPGRLTAVWRVML
ncbi:MAG: glycosyltransferase family 39 protein, partial [Planctomycetaceae bacterium]|nr:glycosyltransferase family 39 protein [Planctomycetaceae bacterium]